MADRSVMAPAHLIQHYLVLRTHYRRDLRAGLGDTRKNAVITSSLETNRFDHSKLPSAFIWCILKPGFATAVCKWCTVTGIVPFGTSEKGDEHSIGYDIVYYEG